MKQHFVTFFSPGTFVNEETTKPIDSWDVKKATKMAADVLERYNATPFGFQFTTRERGENDLDSHVAKRSPMYYLGGQVMTVEQVEAQKDPNNKILIQNMRSNNIERVLVNDNSWRWVAALNPGDVVLDYKR